MGISPTEQTLLYLLNCAVNERVPEKLPEDTDFEALYKLAKFHSVAAMASYALDAGGYLSEKYMPQEQIKQWAAARIGAIRKNIMFDAERDEILQWMEAQGCWYMPLKGVILKEMYPDVGMREMADNDILFDRNFREQLKEYMVCRGYEVEQFAEYINDVYLKKPFFYFECHVDLFCRRSYPEWVPYYEKVKERLIKDENNCYGFHFTEEDFYVYLIVHAYKHYKTSGTGIRSLMDIYVYLNSKSDSMDWTYIYGELKKLGIDRFEKDAKELVSVLFDKRKILGELLLLDRKEMEMIIYIMGSGTYGTLANHMRNKIFPMQSEKMGITFWIKAKLCIQKLFPGMEYMKNCEPFFYQHKFLIPFFWVYRIVRAPFRNRNRILAEMRAIKNMK